jgi:hypothetical protein
MQVRSFGVDHLRRADFRLTAATAMLVALVAGCGGGKTSVASSQISGAVELIANPFRHYPAKTVTSSQASGAVELTKNPFQGRDYPTNFEYGFLSSCAEESSPSQCVCRLLYLEANVMHQVVADEYLDSTFVSSPPYQRAKKICKRE